MHTRARKRQDASRFDGIEATSHSCLQRKQQHARAPKRAARHTAICGQLLISRITDLGFNFSGLRVNHDVSFRRLRRGRHV